MKTYCPSCNKELKIHCEDRTFADLFPWSEDYKARQVLIVEECNCKPFK